MNKKEIRGRLLIKGYYLRDLSRHLNVSEAVISMVINRDRTSRRIQQTIADIIGERVEDVFPPQIKGEKTA